MARRWTYVLTEDDQDQWGNWSPRLVWDDGMVFRSGSRIHGSRTYAEALAEVQQWNWWQGRSQQDTWDVVADAVQHNSKLTEDGYWEEGGDGR